MLDADVAAVSPVSVWRVSKQAELLSRVEEEAVTQGVGFEPPPQPHKHWHVDVSYINLSGTFYTYGVCWTGTVVCWCIGISGSR